MAAKVQNNYELQMMIDKILSLMTLCGFKRLNNKETKLKSIENEENDSYGNSHTNVRGSQCTVSTID